MSLGGLVLKASILEPEPAGSASATVVVSGPPDAQTGLVQYAVTVSGDNGTPTGSAVVFDGTNSCTASLDSGSGTCQLPENAGNYTVTAGYSVKRYISKQTSKRPLILPVILEI